MTPETPSRTAEWVAFMRAAERDRPPSDRILDDPYAEGFLAPFQRARLRLGRPTRGRSTRVHGELTTYIVARHRFMDDALLAALPDVAQIVILGAGYDMRGARFADAIGDRPVFEVDHPATAARKARILKKRGHTDKVRRVTVDFQTESFAEKLEAAGFIPGRPTFFVWEGVSMYLTRAAILSTLAAVARLGGPGSALTMDFWMYIDDPGWVASWRRASASLLHLFSEPITFGLHPDDARAFLARSGFTVTDLGDPAELARRYARDGRPIYPSSYVVTARRAT